MSKQKLALIDGNYPSLTAGGVQCTQLYNNADLNDCVPENDKVFQAWVCTWNGTSNTMSNTPFANFGRTFYLTAVKTWYNRQNADKFRVTQTLYSVEPNGNSLIWTRAIDGAGTLGWSDWKEMVVADGSYPTLGAGYLARRAFVGELNGDQWIKWATVSYPLVIRGSVLFLVNGGQDPNTEGSGILELNLVRQVENVSLVVCSGYIKSENFAYVINGTSIDLYVYCQSYRDYQIAVLDELAGVALNTETYVTFSNVGTGSATAPANAVYAVVRNIASYAESIPAASQTVVGGVKVYTDSEGYLNIDTQ